MKKIWQLLSKSLYLLFRLSLFAGAAVFIVGASLILSLREPIPENATSGPGADQLARSVQQALYYQGGWERSRFIEWSFGGRKHLWDRERGFVKSEWGDLVVLFRISGEKHHVTRAGVQLRGAQAREVAEEAYAFWTNDSFWLYPARTFFDPGVERAVVPDPQSGEPQLLVRYTRGGVTPGDSYLFQLDAERRPVGWRVWTQNLPISGLYIPWGGMERIEPSKIWVSTDHSLLGFSLTMNVRVGLVHIRELVSEDPFGAIERDPLDPATHSRPSR